MSHLICIDFSAVIRITYVRLSEQTFLYGNAVRITAMLYDNNSKLQVLESPQYNNLIKTSLD